MFIESFNFSKYSFLSFKWLGRLSINFIIISFCFLFLLLILSGLVNFNSFLFLTWSWTIFFHNFFSKLAKVTTCYYNTHCFHIKLSLMPLLQLSQSQDPMLRAAKNIIKTKKFCFLGLLVPKLLNTLDGKVEFE